MIDIIFMGTPDYAQKILQRLIEEPGFNVISVYTQPDKPVGRKKVITAPEVKVLAQEHNIDIYQPNRLREEESVKTVLLQKCDFIIVAAYGQILPKEILDHAPCINLHASILPQYRGASPIQQAIFNGDKRTGVTAMLMDVGLDTGDILKISEINIDNDEMVSILFERLTECASELTIEVIKDFDTFIPKKQDDNCATHCKKISKKDGLVTFDDALSIYNKYRAYTPWPGIYLESQLKLKKISLVDSEKSNECGKILEIKKDGIVVGCLKGSLLIQSVQPLSKKEMKIADYLNGKRLELNNILS